VGCCAKNKQTNKPTNKQTLLEDLISVILQIKYDCSQLYIEKGAKKKFSMSNF
jgi:hypothetical protein